MAKFENSGASVPPTQPWAARPQPLEPQVNSCSASGSLERMGPTVWFPRDGEIYRENSPANYLYRVISGTVRIYKALSEGRRQIGAFYMTGDIFGLEAGEVHAFSAEAITDTELLMINRSAVVALAARNHDIVHELWSLTTRELKQVHSHALLLIQSAQERVANFLLEMADRTPGSDEVELPMSRQDIADYLGLTTETVSRMLTQLERAAAIALPTSRRVVLRSRSALKGLKPSLAGTITGETNPS